MSHKCPTCRQDVAEPIIKETIEHRRCSCGEIGTIKLRTRINSKGIKHVYYICRDCQAARHRAYYAKNAHRFPQMRRESKLRSSMQSMGASNLALAGKYA